MLLLIYSGCLFVSIYLEQNNNRKILYNRLVKQSIKYKALLLYRKMCLLINFKTFKICFYICLRIDMCLRRIFNKILMFINITIII